jgi:hypothetical protein
LSGGFGCVLRLTPFCFFVINFRLFFLSLFDLRVVLSRPSSSPFSLALLFDLLSFPSLARFFRLDFKRRHQIPPQLRDTPTRLWPFSVAARFLTSLST